MEYSGISHRSNGAVVSPAVPRRTQPALEAVASAAVVHS